MNDKYNHVRIRDCMRLHAHGVADDIKSNPNGANLLLTFVHEPYALCGVYASARSTFRDRSVSPEIIHWKPWEEEVLLVTLNTVMLYCSLIL